MVLVVEMAAPDVCVGTTGVPFTHVIGLLGVLELLEPLLPPVRRPLPVEVEPEPPPVLEPGRDPLLLPVVVPPDELELELDPPPHHCE